MLKVCPLIFIKLISRETQYNKGFRKSGRAAAKRLLIKNPSEMEGSLSK